MKERIKQLMESQHMTQQTFAELIGISAGSLSSIFSERTKPTLNIVDAIMTKFTNLNLEWLMYGRGPMFKDQAHQDDDVSNSSQADTNIAHQQEKGDMITATLPFANDLPTDYPMRSSLRGAKVDMKYIDKPQRSITEIRIFFDDQTWESFVPKK